MDPITTAFLDRDGVLNRKAPDQRYVTSWEAFEFLPGAMEALRRLSRAGIRTIIVTNQRGIATNQMSRAAVDEIHDRMLEAIRHAGGSVEAVLVCPHGEGECECRKPGVGLFLQALAMFPEIELEQSIVVGDSRSDIEAGNRLGCRTYLVGHRNRRAEILGAGDLHVDGQGRSLLDIVRALVEPGA
jgi:D-glycero-D-manno-heptose 1,7-bisphosphate phosphatase